MPPRACHRRSRNAAPTGEGARMPDDLSAFRPPPPRSGRHTDTRSKPNGAAGTREKPKPKPFEFRWFADEQPVLESRWLVKDFLMASSAAVLYGQSYGGK